MKNLRSTTLDCKNIGFRTSEFVANTQFLHRFSKFLIFRFDSGFRDYGDQEPHLTRAIHAVQFVAQHVKNQDRYDKVSL